ncbi:hypothetical protein GJ672_08560 [Spiribacter sp. 2438]|uniref:MAPEG family protein n=1 Tax=Spiribacter sp. 2438 TaxID=2666185 RepID=UPI0012B07030|nr:MAPEG family protein [Spiribacter sp. 2438]QGM22296.1 hypothetical protein GJ672_08560 [Spiribacter sp. 2438]
MSIAYYCVLAAIFLPIVFAGLAKSRGDFDNARPREWLTSLEGWRQRAHWAQLNTFEAFPPFAAAVIIAHQLGAPQGPVDVLAVLFLVFRGAYGLFYIVDRPTLRSLAWMAAFACTVGLFIIAALA